MPMQLIEIETPLETMQSPADRRQEDWCSCRSCAPARVPRRHAQRRARRARRPRRPVPRPADARRDRVLLQDAARHGGARRDRARPDARDRQLRGRGRRPAEGDAARVRSASSACSPRPKGSRTSHEAHPDVPVYTAAIDRAARTITATSCRASATRATACSAPSRRAQGPPRPPAEGGGSALPERVRSRGSMPLEARAARSRATRIESAKGPSRGPAAGGDRRSRSASGFRGARCPSKNVQAARSRGTRIESVEGPPRAPHPAVCNFLRIPSRSSSSRAIASSSVTISIRNSRSR